MKPPDKIGDRERGVVEARRTHGYKTAELVHFGARLEPTLRALLGRLLPGVPAGIDLVGFVDSTAGEPLGRGDRRAGAPPTVELFVRGVTALADAGFADMTEPQQRDVISRLRNGEPYGALGEHAKDFIDRLLDKALTGYLAHPDAWTRIGFNGPAYPQGYAWIGVGAVAARHEEQPGWDKL